MPSALQNSDERFRVHIADKDYTIAPRRTLLATEQWVLMTFSLQS